MKEFGGIVRNWQLHHLSFSGKQIESVYPGENAQAIVFTGTIVSDPSGKRRPGDHMRSSLIVSVDREKGEIETLNKRYKVQDEGNDISGDLGDYVMNIIY